MFKLYSWLCIILFQFYLNLIWINLKLRLKIKDGQTIPHFPGCPWITPPGCPERALLLFFFGNPIQLLGMQHKSQELGIFPLESLGLSSARPFPVVPIPDFFFAVPGTGGDGQARPAVTSPSAPGHLSSGRAKIGIVTTNKDSLQNPGAGTCRPRRSGLSLPSFPALFAQSRLGKIPIFPSLMNSWLTEPPC